MCISYLTSSDVMTYVIITSESSGGIVYCKIYMCITLKHSGGINFVWQCKNLMYSKKWVVYKLHAGWFINRTAGEFINRGLFVKV